MPYHRHRRLGCKVVHPCQPPFESGRLFEPRVARLPTSSTAARRGPPCRSLIGPGPGARSLDGVVLGVEYLVRPARITDIGRLASLGRGAIGDPTSGSLGAADLLRQLVDLPHASVLIAEARLAEARRELAGVALLVLRPSVVAGGYVGTIDLIIIAKDHDADRVTDALLEELLRSAGNKGCSVVEVAEPSDPEGLSRLERAGFAPAGPTLRRPVAAAGSAARRI